MNIANKNEPTGLIPNTVLTFSFGLSVARIFIGISIKNRPTNPIVRWHNYWLWLNCEVPQSSRRRSSMFEVWSSKFEVYYFLAKERRPGVQAQRLKRLPCKANPTSCAFVRSGVHTGEILTRRNPEAQQRSLSSTDRYLAWGRSEVEGACVQRWSQPTMTRSRVVS